MESSAADETDIAYINNELVRDALLLMGGDVLCYHACRSCTFYIDPVPAIGSYYKQGSVPTAGGQCGWELFPQEDEKRCM